MKLNIRINQDPVHPEIYYNNKWKATDYYMLCTDSELWCCARLYILDKQVTDSADEAIVYLLQRYILETEGWTAQMLNDLTPEQFTGMINLDVYPFRDEGAFYPIEEFTKSYNEITSGMQHEARFTITKNGNPAPDFDFLKEHDVITVNCLADAWNTRQYFIETWTGWAFYSWGTGA